MRELSTTEKLILFAGYVASLGAVSWLLYYRHKPESFVEAIGQLCALTSVLGLLGFCSAAGFADKARRAHWSPQKCQWFPMFVFVLSIAIFAIQSSMWAAVPLLFSTGVLVGILCRRLVYPDLDAEESYRAKQELHILSK